MSLFLTHTAHTDNPPQSWTIEDAGALLKLVAPNGSVLGHSLSSRSARENLAELAERYERESAQWAAGTLIDSATITVSLRVENSHEDGGDYEFTVIDQIVVSPKEYTDEDEWAYENIYAFTGVGIVSGDSFYDVEITASSMPALVGRTFDWGY